MTARHLDPVPATATTTTIVEKVVAADVANAIGVLRGIAVLKMNIPDPPIVVTMKMIKMILGDIGRGTQVLGTNDPPNDPDQPIRSGHATRIANPALMTVASTPTMMLEILDLRLMLAHHLVKMKIIKMTLGDNGRGTQVLGTNDPPNDPGHHLLTELIILISTRDDQFPINNHNNLHRLCRRKHEATRLMFRA